MYLLFLISFHRILQGSLRVVSVGDYGGENENMGQHICKILLVKLF